jgi:nitrate/nitrite transport system substrate-binding protein
MRELGQMPPEGAFPKFTIMGKVFDPAKPEEYLKSFAVARAA